jgi:predicted GH43/DUF377 family glycosyl hydrolase
VLVFCQCVAMVMSFKNIKKYIFMRKKENKNKDNLVINVNFNHEYIMNIKKIQNWEKNWHSKFKES